MVRRTLISLVVLAVTVGLQAPAEALSCTLTEIVSGNCAVGGTTDGTGVNLWVDGSTGGDGSVAGGGGAVDCEELQNGRCVGSSPSKNVDKPESVNDLESFRPVRPGQRSEPSGWTIAGLPTNFVTTARTHIVSGTLAGYPADVRFIPIGYRRTFGDGAHQSMKSKGARWAQPWSATRTSHVYAAPGSFTVGVTVTYRAEYRYGSGAWTRLGGAVTRTAPELALRAFGADTVLVARTCVAGAIGCA